MSGYNKPRRGTARTLPIVVLYYVLIVFVSFHVLFVCKCVLLPPGDNPIAVNKYIIYAAAVTLAIHLKNYVHNLSSSRPSVP
jgi:hypothetical protein